MKLPVAVQLYSVRDEMEKDFYGTIQQMKDLGYDGVEFAGLFGEDPEKIKAFCEETENAAAGMDDDWGIRDNPVIWKVSLFGAGPNPIRKDGLDNDCIRIGWSCYGSTLPEKIMLWQ